MGGADGAAFLCPINLEVLLSDDLCTLSISSPTDDLGRVLLHDYFVGESATMENTLLM